MSRLKIVFPICCGVDVHRDFIVACIAIARRLLTAIFHMLLKSEVYNGQLYQKAEKAPVQRTLTPEQALMFLRKKGFVIIDPATQTVAPPDDVNTVA